MFTGIVQGLAKVIEIRPSGGGVVLYLEADFDLTDPQEGESIAVNGACLTARDIQGRRFFADVSPETLSRTGLALLQTGSQVNLERALQLSDRLGGHIVSGHIDCLATVEERRATGDFTHFTFSLPQDLMKYVIEKGSITINGVSLTVNSCEGNRFSVSIIPHSLSVTTLGLLQNGNKVNIEVDILGKYVEKLLTFNKDNPKKESQINSGFLSEHGFI